MKIFLTSACAAAALGVAGCAAADKSGAPVKSQVTLTMQVSDVGDPLSERFAADVARRTGGSVRIRIDQDAPYTSQLASNEWKLARALEAGQVDVGYVAARAWGALGLPAFQALLAPFVITTYPVAQSVAEGPVGRQVLATLPRSVVGIALVPAEVRRVLATRPPDSLDAFRGLRVRVVDNPQSVADFRALGAVPVQGLASNVVGERFNQHALDGVESSPSAVLSNSYATVAPYLSAYAIFPKYQSIVFGAAAWRKLSGAQQQAVRAAARATVAAARTDVPRDERDELARLCRAGVRLTVASPAQLRELAAATRPATPSAGILAALRALPGAGPQPLATPLPAACSAPAAAPTPAPRHATIPNGVYVTTTTVADLRKGNVIGKDFNRDLTYRTTLKDGRWSQTETPNYPDQGPWDGTYSVNGDEVTFRMLHAAGGDLATPETVKWSYFNRRLRFEIVDVADSDSIVIYTAHPWRKVG